MENIKIVWKNILTRACEELNETYARSADARMPVTLKKYILMNILYKKLVKMEPNKFLAIELARTKTPLQYMINSFDYMSDLDEAFKTIADSLDTYGHAWWLTINE